MGRKMGGHNQQYVMKGISQEAATELANKFKGEAELWQKRFEEKEKECEELKLLGNDCVKTINSQTKELQELKAENERLKRLVPDHPKANS